MEMCKWIDWKYIGNVGKCVETYLIEKRRWFRVWKRWNI